MPSSKLPVYLLLDASASMAVDAKRQALCDGLLKFKRSLARDPYALATTRVSVITFGGVVRQTIPLTDIEDFDAPTIVPCGPTPLGAALRLVKECAEREVAVSSPERRGDYRPLVYLLTDGKPTDAPETFQECLEAFKSYPWAKVVACAVGRDVQFNLLRSITPTIIQLETADASTIHSFFEWISESLSVCSACANKDPSSDAVKNAPLPQPKNGAFLNC